MLKAEPSALKRSLTSCFLQHRQEAATAGRSRPHGGAQLLDAGDAAKHPLLSPQSLEPPVWLGMIKPLERRLEQIEEDTHAFKSHLDRWFFVSNPGSEKHLAEQQECMEQADRIMQKIRSSQLALNEISAVPIASLQLDCMRRDIVNLLATSLKRNAQELGRLQLDHREKVSQANTSVFGIERDRARATAPGPSPSGDAGAQVVATATTTAFDTGPLLEQRQADVRRVAGQVEELADIFQNIVSLIENQGPMLDRIDANIDNTDHHITVAQSEIRGAVSGERAFSKFLLGVLVFVITYGVFMTALAWIK